MCWTISKRLGCLAGLLGLLLTPVAMADDSVTSYYGKQPTADELIRNLTGPAAVDDDLPEDLLPADTGKPSAVSFRGVRVLNATTSKPDEQREVTGVAAKAPPASRLADGQECSIRGKAIALRVEFASGSASVDARSQSVLDELAKAMNSPLLTNCIFSVEGHTDARGDANYNMRLSWDRALSVKHFLISESVDPLRLAVVGRGEEEPLLQEDPKAAENRRVQVRIVGRK